MSLEKIKIDTTIIALSTMDEHWFASDGNILTYELDKCFDKPITVTSFWYDGRKQKQLS